jgi:LmbE family N-acetylglucosaminyl deacetylase
MQGWKLRPAALAFAALAILIGVLGLPGFLAFRGLGPAPAYADSSSALPAGCSAGTLVTVVAHLDDDLLFVNPGISDRLHDGWCIVTVHVIGGADNSKFNYVLLRERGVRQAYARMAGVPDRWTESTVSIAGRPVHRMVLDAAPHVVLLEMRLPGGQVRGGRVPIGLVWDEGATIASYPMNADGSGGVARYDRAHIIATLGALLSQATLIYTLNPDTVPFLEHPDHIYCARITREAAHEAHAKAPIIYHLTYVTSNLPINVPAGKTQLKRDEVASYFAVDSDGGNLAQVFGEYEWNGNWVARRYAFHANAGGGSPDRPDGATPAVRLVNEQTSQCLSDGSEHAERGHTSPRLATCDGSRAQQWRWQPLPSYPGNPHNAALVSVSSSRCVAERDATLVEAACDDNDIAQRFTPWDFGIVRTPLGHCLGEKDGTPALARCESLTAAYRWALTPQSARADLRIAGAMYGDLGGDGKPSAVYVERRGDGPGFDVEVLALEPGERASRWYSNAVPFDSRAIVPSCRGETLCFDSTRFLLADFRGTGRADLMAIAPGEHGSTAFWLFENTGHGAFSAPRLWYQSTSMLDPDRTQQYVAGDFDGDGHADVMAAQRTPDGRGFDLWVLTSRGASGNAPSLWGKSVPLAPAARFYAARLSDSPQMGLVALEDTNGALTVASIASSGHAFAPHFDTVQFSGLRTARSKVAVGPIDTAKGSRLDSLVVLSAREPSASNRANIDVWTIGPAPDFGKPIHAGTIADVPWADALPALITRPGATGGSTSTSLLALFERVSAPLDEYHVTGGAPALVGYSLAARGQELGAAERFGDLPGRYSETLWLERLR